MSTFMANKGNIERKWYVIDAAGKPMGKTAVAAADLLRGKRKVTYSPARRLRRQRHHHQRFQGHPHRQQDGAEVLSYALRLGRRSEGDQVSHPHAGEAELAMRVAVRGMMPRNTVTKDSLKRLHIYAGDTHEQQAQKPEAYEV